MKCTNKLHKYVLWHSFVVHDVKRCEIRWSNSIWGRENETGIFLTQKYILNLPVELMVL